MLSRTRPLHWTYAALPAALTTFLFACSSGSSGGVAPALEEDEPGLNDSFDGKGVQALTASRTGHGVLDDETDVDFWSIALTEGWVVSVELFGARLDHATWDDDDTIPVVTIYDSDGTTVLVNHDYTGTWSWGRHDLDHPLLRVPATGTYYASVSAEGGTVTDGDYAIRVSLVNIGALQLETGDDGGDNDTFANAEAINPGTVYGFHDAGNSDYFSFVVTTPSVVRFETTAYRNGVFEGAEHFDPEIFLYDTDGTTELTSNNDVHFYDSGLHVLIDTPGTYFLDVNDDGGPVGPGPYFLTYSRTAAGGGVESEANDSFATADPIAYGGSITGTFVLPALVGAPDSDYLTFNGTAGDMVRVQYFDSSNSFSDLDVSVQLFGPDEGSLEWGGDEELQTLTTILQETGAHFILVSGVDAGASEYRVELTRFKTATYEVEPNNDFESANALGTRSAGVIDGVVLGGPVDADTFSFSASIDRLTTVSIYASSSATSSDGIYNYSDHGSDLEPTLRILDSEGVPIAASFSDWLTVSSESVTNGLPCAAVSFIAPESGTYYVEVTDSSNNSGSSYYYVIELTN